LRGGNPQLLMSALGQKQDMCTAKRHVCFTPNSDRESEIPQKAMSALPPKADMCGALVHPLWANSGHVRCKEDLVFFLQPTT